MWLAASASSASSASRGLSSTRRMRLKELMARSFLWSASGGRPPFQREIKRGALVHCAFGPDAAPVPRHDPPDGGQTNAGAFELLGPVQPLEDAEQLVGILHVEPGAVVADEQDDPSVFFAGAADLDPPRVAPA